MTFKVYLDVDLVVLFQVFSSAAALAKDSVRLPRAHPICCVASSDSFCKLVGYLRF